MCIAPSCEIGGDRLGCHGEYCWRVTVGGTYRLRFSENSITLMHDFRHLMTGTGAYFYLTWGIWLRHCLNGRQDEYDLSWPSFWSLPEVVPRKRANGDGRCDPSKKIS